MTHPLSLRKQILSYHIRVCYFYWRMALTDYQCGSIMLKMAIAGTEAVLLLQFSNVVELGDILKQIEDKNCSEQQQIFEPFSQ